jgi:hypothetical protein
MGCGCNKKKTKKKALYDAKKVSSKRRPTPLVTIRRKSLKKITKR